MSSLFWCQPLVLIQGSQFAVLLLPLYAWKEDMSHASIRSIPEIDLSLLSVNKDAVCAQIKHALIEYGAFYVTGIDEHFDDNIATLVHDQASQLFGSAQKEKNALAMANSRAFLGYSQEQMPATLKTVAESLDFGHGGPKLDSEQDYKNIMGENQLPPSDKFPYFEKSVDNVFTSMGSFSKLVTDLITVSLEIETQELQRSISPREPSHQFYKLQLKSLLPLPSTTTTQPHAYSPHKSTSLLTYTFQPASKEPSMQFQDIFGEWLDLPFIKPSIVVTVGQSLEHITQGVTMASTYRMLPTSTARIVTHFHQHANLDSRLFLLTVDKKLLDIAKRRDLLRSPLTKTKFQPESPVAKMLFLECVRSYREVSRKWYLPVLKAIEEQDKKNKLSNDSQRQFEDSTSRQPKLVKLFTALDSVIYLNVPTRTSDIKLYSLLPQVNRLCPFTVQLQELLEVFYIWPTFVSLKVNNDQEFIIDIDETRDMLSIKNIHNRVEKFTILLTKWMDSHRGVDIPALAVSDVKKKVTFQGLERKRGTTEILQKDTTKKKKNTNENGLSLLQRIKQKEQDKLDKFVSPEERYLNYLDGKIGQVLDIVATMRPDKPHSIDRLTEQVMNSLKSKNALAEKESRDLVLHLPTKFPDVFRIIKGREISVLKWSDFDANEVKKRLQK